MGRRTALFTAVALVVAGAATQLPGSPLRLHPPAPRAGGVVEGPVSDPSDLPSVPPSDTAVPSRPPVPAPRMTSGPYLRAGPVSISVPGFSSWALLETAAGKISGSATLTRASDTASMIKAWLAADYLRRTAERGAKPTSTQLQQLSTMIRDSDNAIAEQVFQALGGSSSIGRLISICKLTDSRAAPGFWSYTMMSARDTVRMGRCIQDGRAAGRQWTGWVLGEMRQVRGDGRFGIIEALPAEVARTTAIKNGWLLRDEDQKWHMACLAVGEGWVLAVMLVYPGALGFDFGARVCRSVAAQLHSR
jgi:hypothetical protein